jgi:hypothetical protein
MPGEENWKELQQNYSGKALENIVICTPGAKPRY